MMMIVTMMMYVMKRIQTSFCGPDILINIFIMDILINILIIDIIIDILNNIFIMDMVAASEKQMGRLPATPNHPQHQEQEYALCIHILLL